MGEGEREDAHIYSPREISPVPDDLMNRDDLFLEIGFTLHFTRSTNRDTSNESIINAVSDLKADRLLEKGMSAECVWKTFKILMEPKFI